MKTVVKSEVNPLVRAVLGGIGEHAVSGNLLYPMSMIADRIGAMIHISRQARGNWLISFHVGKEIMQLAEDPSFAKAVSKAFKHGMVQDNLKTKEERR